MKIAVGPREVSRLGPAEGPATGNIWLLVFKAVVHIVVVLVVGIYADTTFCGGDV